jgi:hypothetical protein
MTQPYWAESLEAAKRWNNPVLGNVHLPGIWTVTVEKGRDVEFNKAKGKDGGNTKDNGAAQGKVTIEGVIPNRQIWEEWLAIEKDLDPNKPGALKKPLEISHPATERRGIRAVYVVAIKESPPTARGGLRITIECHEWFPAPKPTKAAKTPEPASLTHPRFPAAIRGVSSDGANLAPTDSATVLRNLLGEQDDNDSEFLLGNEVL